jgi:uracil-xanthine permease
MAEERDQTVIYPENVLPFWTNVIAGVQHVIAMFGATVLGPLLIGFDPNTAIFFSGIATILFYFVMCGRVPSYLGSSFSFIAAVIAATAYSGTGANPNAAVALGGIVVAGALYASLGLIIMATGHQWLQKMMPPVLTGAIVAIIGLNLAPVAVTQISANSFDTIFGLGVIVAVACAAVYLKGFASRLPILIGGGFCYVVYIVLSMFGLTPKPIDFSGLTNAAWFGFPGFSTPVFDPVAIALIAPVALILAAENLGHIKAIGAMTARNMDPFLGRAFLGDGLATVLSGSFGGTGVTTYAENMGVMAITKNFSSRTFVFAGIFAILLGMSPKFGALIHTIPMPVIGGLSFVVFGLITATAGRIWTDNKVDFTNPRNLIVVGVAVVAGAGNLTIKMGSFAFGGIAVATFGALILYHALSLRSVEPEPQ